MNKPKDMLVSDEHIAKRVEEYIEPYRKEITRVSTEVRDRYEAELTKLRAERDELVGALREQSKWLTWVPMHHMDDADQSEFASDSKCVDELIAKHKPE